MTSKILIVDDEQSIGDIISYNLQKEGFEVENAYDGLQCLEKLEQKEFDLVLLDVMMPKLDGFQTLKRIRKDSRIPVIMLTAKEEEVDKILGLELGADDYVVKPFPCGSSLPGSRPTSAAWTMKVNGPMTSS